ncbi:hypothetical protein [uncultured Corynebacterium sp.]|uniref:hypothetical protein n=1 Tax=uncultured Corynebacterium sp. TaxID=159447 RepID=UPI0025EAB9F0|nr:hypothetical protein [uncultured Corynebacterium sp.]
MSGENTHDKPPWGDAPQQGQPPTRSTVAGADAGVGTGGSVGIGAEQTPYAAGDPDTVRDLDADASRYQPLPQGSKKTAIWAASLIVVGGLLAAPVIIDKGAPGDYPGDKHDGDITVGMKDSTNFTGPNLGECYDQSDDNPYGSTYKCGNVNIDTATMTGNDDVDHVFRRGIRATAHVKIDGDLPTTEASNGEWDARVTALEPKESVTSPNAKKVVSAAFTKQDDKSTTIIATVSSADDDVLATTMSKIVSARGLKTDAVRMALTKSAASDNDSRGESDEYLPNTGEA